jgi:hypothetical protein
VPRADEARLKIVVTPLSAETAEDVAALLDLLHEILDAAVDASEEQVH